MLPLEPNDFIEIVRKHPFKTLLIVFCIFLSIYWGFDVESLIYQLGLFAFVIVVFFIIPPFLNKIKAKRDRKNKKSELKDRVDIKLLNLTESERNIIKKIYHNNSRYIELRSRDPDVINLVNAGVLKRATREISRQKFFINELEPVPVTKYCISQYALEGLTIHPEFKQP